MDKKDCEKLFSKICPFQQSTSLYPRFFKQFKLFVDVSDDSIRPALFKEHSDSVDKVVFLFFQETYQMSTKIFYHRKEMFCLCKLFIIFMFIYVTVHPILEYTDHNRRLTRWS